MDIETMLNDNKMFIYIRDHLNTLPGMLQTGSVSIIWSLIESQQHLHIQGNIAEIGVYKGKLFSLLAMALSGSEKIYGFDIFTYDNQEPEKNKNNLMDNLIRLGHSPDSVRLFITDSNKMESHDLLELFGGQTVRFFSVDGDHSRQSVYHDLTLACSCTQDSGVILADDLFNTAFPEVTEAIIDFYRDKKMGEWEPIAIITANGPIRSGCSKLVIVHSSHAQIYKKYLAVMNNKNLFKVTNFMNYSNVLVFDFEHGVHKIPLAYTNL